MSSNRRWVGLVTCSSTFRTLLHDHHTNSASTYSSFYKYNLSNYGKYIEYIYNFDLSFMNVMKAANVKMFRKKQLLMPGLLLFLFMSVVSANETVDTIAILGSRVELSCPLPASHQTVTWEIDSIGGISITVAACHVSTAECAIVLPFGIEFQATRSETSSSLFISFSGRGQRHFRCLSGGVIQQTYNITFIEQPVILPPNCSIIPTTSHQGRDAMLAFSCESYGPHELPYLLTMFGFNENISTRGKSDLHIVNGVDVENFKENLNVVCELRIPDVNISESCSFPHSAHVTYTPDVTMVTDVVFDCHADPGDTVTWRLLDSEGREEDMTGRSWTRDGGRSLLIRNITEQDLGKVAECQMNGSVGFRVINDIDIDTDTDNDNDIGQRENEGCNGASTGTWSHGDRSVYITLTLVFGGLLLLCY